MNIFKRAFAYLRYYAAVCKAEKAYAKFPRRYYVLPMQGRNHRLVVVDRKNFRTLKQKHYIDPDVTLNQLTAECFYYTAHLDGSDPIMPTLQRAKYRSYLDWWEKPE